MTDADNTIVTRNSDEFFATCERAKRGEIRIAAVSVGRMNGEWIFELVPEPVQKELIPFTPETNSVIQQT